MEILPFEQMEEKSASTPKSIFRSPALRWLCALSYQAFLYGTLSIIRDVVSFLEKNINLKLSLNIIFGLLAVMIIGFSIKVFKKRFKYYFWLFLILFAYAFSIDSLPIITERIHFIQYGLFTFLILWALDVSFENDFFYILSFFYISLSGCIDEFIQYFLPNRYYDIKDIAINALSCLLALFLIRLISHSRFAQKHRDI